MVLAGFTGPTERCVIPVACLEKRIDNSPAHVCPKAYTLEAEQIAYSRITDYLLLFVQNSILLLKGVGGSMMRRKTFPFAR
jgi:hypothetical protein